MEISLKTITLYTTLLLTGLSAGFFYAWAVSVIPGTRKVLDLTYLETMQSINRAILNPAFFLVFLGSLVLLLISTVQHYQSGAAFWLLLAAGLAYLLGTFGVTGLGNVPLNDALDVLDLGEMSAAQLRQARQQYELRWNRLHMTRTVFSVLTFLLALLALFPFARNF